MNEPVRPDDMRISDVDRERVQDQLKRAHDVGQLDLHEFDVRVQSAWAAKTRGDLVRVTADLPEPPPPPPEPTPEPTTEPTPDPTTEPTPDPTTDPPTDTGPTTGAPGGR